MKISSDQGKKSSFRCPRCKKYLTSVLHGTSTIYICDWADDHWVTIVDIADPENRPLMITQSPEEEGDGTVSPEEMLTSPLPKDVKVTGEGEYVCQICEDPIFKASSQDAFELHMKWHQKQNKEQVD